MKKVKTKVVLPEMEHPELVKNVQEFIVSMEELIKRYEASIELGLSKSEYEDNNANMRCLLCYPIGVEENYGYFCRVKGLSHIAICEALGCPWITILGMTCDQFSRSHTALDGWQTIYNTHNVDVQRDRIEQLKEWIQIYRAIPEG